MGPHRFLEACLGVDTFHSGREIQLVYQHYTVNTMNTYFFYLVFSDKPKNLSETIQNRFCTSKWPSLSSPCCAYQKLKIKLMTKSLVDINHLVFHEAPNLETQSLLRFHFKVKTNLYELQAICRKADIIGQTTMESE